MAKPKGKLCRRCGGTGVEPDFAQIGEEMKKLRERGNLSLRDMGKRVERSASYLSDCEHGNRRFSPELIAAYRDAVFK